MTATPSPTLRYLAPLLLAIAATLAAANWYFEPAKVAGWTTVLVTVAGIALVLWLLPWGMEKAAEANGWNSALRNGVDSIRGAVVFASLMLMARLGPNLAESLELVGPDALDEFGRRGTMVLTGLFFVFTGNSVPKIMTPLSACHSEAEAAKAQAVQRFLGWTWVLMGFGFAIPWLVLPVDIAEPLSTTIMFGGILTGATKVFMSWRAHRPRPN